LKYIPKALILTDILLIQSYVVYSLVALH